MPSTIVVEFPSGNRVRFGSGADGGLHQAGITSNLAEKSGEQFGKALGALGDVVAKLEEAVGRLAHRPDSVEIEFSASLEGECDLWVVSGKGEAEFKVTLSWGKP